MIHEFEHYIGEDTAVKIIFEYEPAQKAIMHPADAAQPGFCSEVIINEVLINCDDIMGDLTDECISNLAQAALEDFEEKQL